MKSHWLDKTLDLLFAETSNLRKLAEIAGADPKEFYDGANFRESDLRDEDLTGLKLDNAILDNCKLTKKQRDKRVELQLPFDLQKPWLSQYKSALENLNIDGPRQATREKIAKLAMNSLSLSGLEKFRVLQSLPSLSEFQESELIKVFDEELDKFRELVDVHTADVSTLIVRQFGADLQSEEFLIEFTEGVSQATANELRNDLNERLKIADVAEVTTILEQLTFIDRHEKNEHKIKAINERKFEIFINLYKKNVVSENEEIRKLFSSKIPPTINDLSSEGLFFDPLNKITALLDSVLQLGDTIPAPIIRRAFSKDISKLTATLEFEQSLNFLTKLEKLSEEGSWSKLRRQVQLIRLESALVAANDGNQNRAIAFLKQGLDNITSDDLDIQHVFLHNLAECYLVQGELRDVREIVQSLLALNATGSYEELVLKFISELTFTDRLPQQKALINEIDNLPRCYICRWSFDEIEKYVIPTLNEGKLDWAIKLISKFEHYKTGK